MSLRKLFFLLTLFLLACWGGSLADAQRQAKCRPITQIKLSRGISSKLAKTADKNRLLAAEVRKCGVSFTLTDDFEQELRDEGASDELIAAIRANGPRVQPTPTPAPRPPSSVRLNSYSFETVKLDKNGNVAARPKGEARSYQEDLGGGVLLEMTLVPGGEFMMGSPDSEALRGTNESPRRRVAVPEFYLGRYEVTQEQWRAVAADKSLKVKIDLNPEPSTFKGGGKLPVESISWFEAVEFCARLKKKTGRDYRLPTEAEWEYAARAGAETPFAFGETITPYYVNYNGNYPYIGDEKELYRAKTVPVDLSDATFAGIPNAFGLYQMHGNVWEWCLDEYKETYNGAPSDGRAVGQTKDVPLDAEKARVLRGGSWYSYASNCRSAIRNWNTPRDRSFNLGFRVAVASSK